MRTPARLALLAALLLAPASSARAQWFWGASSDIGTSSPFAGAGYSSIWAYPTDLSNGPSPYYSPVFNSLAASPPSLEPSPYARSPLDRLRFNRPSLSLRKHGLFHRR